MTFQQGDAGALPYRSRFFGRSVEIRSAVHSTAAACQKTMQTPLFLL